MINREIKELKNQIRKSFLNSWRNITEKEWEIEINGAEWTAEFIYELILTPLGY